MRTISSLTALTLLTLTSCIGDSDLLSSTDQLQQVRGAIFTTLEDGSRVNNNIYDAKEDVYLDGGPSGGSPSGAAALEEGDYYFQVTDPSGKDLLSSDAIECRAFHVSGDGVITDVIPAGGCEHDTGVDEDHAALGAITVQLIPYDDTPNPGGEYKVWVTSIEDYIGDGDEDVAGSSYGFVPADSKTDNFKVRAKKVECPPCGCPEPEPEPCHTCSLRL